MIRDKIIFNKEFSIINQKCFACNQFTHSIEECPKLHYIPNIEKIVKILNFPFLNERAEFFRNRKKFQNSIKKKIFNAKSQKIFEDKMKKLAKAEPTSFVNSEDSDSMDAEEKREKDNEILLEAEKNLAKEKEILFAFPTEVSKTFTEENKNYFHEQSNIIITLKENEEMKDSNKEGQLLIKATQRKDNSQKDISFEHIMRKKTPKNEENKQISKNKLEIPPEIEIEIEMDRVCTFQKYFPESNVEQIIKRFYKIINIEKEISKKYLKGKYRSLKYYLFASNAILERFLKETKIKKKNARRKTLFIDKRKNILEGVDSFLTDLKSVAPEQLTFYTSRKKSFFGGNQPKKQKIQSFAELINTLVQNNKLNKSKIKISRKSSNKWTKNTKDIVASEISTKKIVNKSEIGSSLI